jgi:hypothetical protein
MLGVHAPCPAPDDVNTHARTHMPPPHLTTCRRETIPKGPRDDIYHRGLSGQEAEGTCKKREPHGDDDVGKLGVFLSRTRARPAPDCRGSVAYPPLNSVLVDIYRQVKPSLSRGLLIHRTRRGGEGRLGCDSLVVSGLCISFAPHTHKHLSPTFASIRTHARTHHSHAANPNSRTLSNLICRTAILSIHLFSDRHSTC